LWLYLGLAPDIADQRVATQRHGQQRQESLTCLATQRHGQQRQESLTCLATDGKGDRPLLLT
jgi:hypothetical protein